jgi:hypothetical protein
MPYLSAQFLACLARLDPKSFYRILSLIELEPVVGQKPTDAQKYKFNANQALILLIVTDMIRAGIKGPRASTWGGRIAETLLFAPDADRVTVEYRANGAGFFFAGDEAPEAAAHAGAARFRLSFDVAEYRAVVAKAFAERAEQMGVRDEG